MTEQPRPGDQAEQRRPGDDLVLGIDVGTTNTKTVLVGPSGRVTATATRTTTLEQLDGIRCLQRPDDWWRSVVECVHQVSRGIDTTRIRALSVSVQGGTMTPLDTALRPLGPARSWLDQRCTPEAEELARTIGDAQVRRMTGWPIAPNNTALQIRALAREEPALFAGATAFADTAAYLYGRLTGELVIDKNTAGITQLFEVDHSDWSTDMLDFVGVDRTRLPKLVESGSVIGTVTPATAEELGLGSSTLVIAGGHDQYCAALGAGCSSPGLLLSCGTAWVCLGLHTGPHRVAAESFAFGRGIRPDEYGSFGEVLNGGVSLERLRQQLTTATGSRPTLAECGRLAAGAAIGAQGAAYFPDADHPTHPELGGSLVGRQSRHPAAEIIRAVLEGVTFAAAALVEQYASAIAADITPIVTGGATASPLWRSIIVNIVGRPTTFVSGGTTAALGAAMVAAVGADLHPSITSAQTQMAAPLGGAEVLFGRAEQRPEEPAVARYREVAAARAEQFTAGVPIRLDAEARAT